jgi:proline dehydrogenase
MIIEWIPDFLVRFFARPYVAGDKLQDGLDVAHQLYDGAAILSTLDLLAEEVTSERRVQENLETYLEMLDMIAADERFAEPDARPTVSVKLSSFTTSPLDKGGDARGVEEAMRAVTERAKDRAIGLTIDMEDHRWTEFTLALSLQLFEQGFDVGTVLQSRLLRTDDDIERIPAGMRIRTVIGIYPEPAEVAVTDRSMMKARLVSQSERLLERGAYVEFATHDEVYLRRFFTDVVQPAGIDGSRFEIQMLYGVPRANALQEIQNGQLGAEKTRAPKIRLYVPFATAWDQATAYCRRRLASNPALALYVLRNLLGSARGQRPGIAQYLSN